MQTCVYCKSRVSPHDRKCPSCGSTVFITEAEPAAPSADTYHDAYREGYRDAYFETQRAQAASQPQPVYTQVVYAQEHSPRNRWIGLLLCLGGGLLGLHRFYAGKIGSGVVYLCSGGLFGIGVVVDALNLLFGNFRDKQGRLMA